MSLVSLIVTCYNKEKFIEHTIQSILAQTYRNWELIIIDDCSIDSSASIIENYIKDERIKLIVNKQNKGANYSRNIGIGKSSGNFIIFIDADDLLSSNCLEKRIGYATKMPDVNLFVFSMGVFKKKIGDDDRKWIPRSKAPLNDFLMHDLPWSILQPMWRKVFLIELGGFDESFQRLQDVELSTRALLHANIKYKLVKDEIDCYYRIDSERRNYKLNEFLTRWINSTIQYCEKYYILVPDKLRTCLLGTIFKTQLHLIYYYKKKEITLKDFNSLESRLMNNAVMIKVNRVKKIIWKIGRYMNINFYRIPGLNTLLIKLLCAY